jgi:putative transposase
MVESPNGAMSISHQCDLLGLCRSRFYYKPLGQEKELNLTLMQELDKQYLKTPFYGIRRMTVHLQSLGYMVNHKRVKRLLRRFIENQTPQNPIKSMKSIHTC